MIVTLSEATNHLYNLISQCLHGAIPTPLGMGTEQNGFLKIYRSLKPPWVLGSP